MATFARFAGAILMGTALAVVVEARASAFAAGFVGTAYYAELMLFSPFWWRSRTSLAVDGWC